MDAILVFLGLVLIVLGIIFYFIPALVAQNNNHAQTGAIFALNLFLGWTLLGWVIALVWACMKSEPKHPETVINEINNSAADEIKKLAELKEQGILTDEEFNARKKQILEKE